VGVLAWLGLRRGDAYPNVDALLRELREALPEDEGFVLRYIAVVIVLLGKVAYADGRFSAEEETSLRALLSHVERMAPSGVEAVCKAMRRDLGGMTESELELCYRELRALCDGRERVEVMRLLARLAAADGALSEAELKELSEIASELGVPPGELEAVEREVERENGRAAS